MSKVLVLGAGMVAKPLVNYLLDHGFEIVLGDLNLAQASRLIDNHPRGKAIYADASSPETWRPWVATCDLVVSLLPPPFHPQVAKACLEEKKHFASASYLSETMSAMDEEARASNLIFLNEMGLDPGLDHATAMELIEQAREQGYEIESFCSHCGGIPSRKAANNPLRYKFSWSPRGVLGALTRASKFKRNGQVTEIAGNKNLAQAQIVTIPGAGVFESTPNADSLFYGARYGLEKANTVYRGTLRFPGWAQFWMFMLEMGFLDQERKAMFQKTQAMEAVLQLAGHDSQMDVAAHLQKAFPSHASVFLDALEQMGLLDPTFTISGSYSCFEILLDAALRTMQYDKDEADWVVLHHEFLVSKNGKREKWTSTLTQEGHPEKETTAMALTVGIPLGISVRLILENQIPDKGVMIPIHKTIYQPLLKELGTLGLAHTVKKQSV